MGNQNGRISTGSKTFLLFSYFGSFWGIMLILALLQIAGKGPFGNDAHLVEFNICLNDAKYEPIAEVAIDTKVIFVCGIIEGTGVLQSVLHVHKNEGMIQSKLFDHKPSIFYERISLDRRLVRDQYTIDFSLAKQVITQTHFIAINPLSQ